MGIGQILGSWESAIFIEEKKLFSLMQTDFKKNRISFGSRSIHNKLTLTQLNKLYEENVDKLIANKQFLELILRKSMPKSLMRYSTFSEWTQNAPRVHKLQYNQIIKNFIIKHLDSINRDIQSYKCALLHYLIQQQYDTDGTFSADLLIEYLRIPKRRSYNSEQFRYYDSYNNRYLDQQRNLKEKNRFNTNKIQTNQNDEGAADKNNDALLDKIEFIGSPISSSNAVGSSPSFAEFRSNDGADLIKKALRYFFANTEKMTVDLSDEFKQGIDSDTAKFKKLKALHKKYEKERKKKLLSELQQRN